MRPLHNEIQRVIEEIVDDILHLPNGYKFWFSLPSTGIKSQKAVKHYWVKVLTSILFPKEFHTALLYAVLDDNGIPRKECILLYKWAITVFYRGNEARIYKDWLSLKGH